MVGAVADTERAASGRMSTVCDTESVRQPRDEIPFTTTMPVVAVPAKVTPMVLVPCPLTMVPPVTRQRYEAGTGPAAE